MNTLLLGSTDTSLYCRPNLTKCTSTWILQTFLSLTFSIIVLPCNHCQNILHSKNPSLHAQHQLQAKSLFILLFCREGRLMQLLADLMNVQKTASHAAIVKCLSKSKYLVPDRSFILQSCGHSSPASRASSFSFIALSCPASSRN